MVTDIAHTRFASGLLIDKVLGTYEDSFALVAPAGAGLTTSVTIPITTNIPTNTFFDGIYSLDNGATWNGFQTRISHVESVDPAVNPQGEVNIYGESTANTFTIQARNSANGGATLFFSYTVLYKVALIAKPNQGILEPQPIASNQFFNTNLNYQKIAFDTVTPSSGLNQTVSITHDLGYIPRARAFIEVAGILRSKGFYLSSTLGLTTTTASLYIPGTVTCDAYIRVYYDE